MRPSATLIALLLPLLAPEVRAQPTTAPPTTAETSPAVTGSPAVDSFMATRSGAPIWLREPGSSVNVAKLVAVLRRAPIDGFASGPQLADQIEAAMKAAPSGDVQATARLDRLLSSAWVDYVTAIGVRSSELVYADPSLPAPPAPAVILARLASAASLSDHLDAVSVVNPIYAKLRDAAWATVQSSGVMPGPRLMQNLARARALPSSGKFLLVNSATQQLTMVEDGRIVDSMKIIVGTRLTPTPMLASMIWYVTVNPYWYVPTDLTQRIVAVRMQANPKYLTLKNYEVISDFGANPTLLSPTGIDWKAVQAGKRTTYLRQLPGERNSMGKMKFSFPNETGVYLHDTDLRGLFAKETRLLSNGCVRLEDAQRLGRWMMGHEVTPVTGAPEEQMVLPKGIPVFLTYITAKADEGVVTYVPDPYHRDLSS